MANKMSLNLTKECTKIEGRDRMLSFGFLCAYERCLSKKEFSNTIVYHFVSISLSLKVGMCCKAYCPREPPLVITLA